MTHSNCALDKLNRYKLNCYHKEAELYRMLPKESWRGRAAKGLRGLAARLEAPTRELPKGAPRVG